MNDISHNKSLANNKSAFDVEFNLFMVWLSL